MSIVIHMMGICLIFIISDFFYEILAFIHYYLFFYEAGIAAEGILYITASKTERSHMTVNENREYKNDVFCMLMEEPEYALDVYNALNRSHYTDPLQVEIVTLGNGISVSINNDASFIIGTDLNFYEHQSTYNPNMPLRSLVYLVETLKPMLTEMDLYGRRKIGIPTPRFVIFYNGSEKRPEEEIQKLSDAYLHEENDIPLELVCMVYNINKGQNEDLIKKSRVLHGYSEFVARVKENLAVGISNPIEEAMEYCIKHQMLEDFFSRRGEEVLKVMTIDMTFEKREKFIREDSRAEGYEEGRKEGQLQLLINLLAQNMISLEDAMKVSGKSKDELL